MRIIGEMLKSIKLARDSVWNNTLLRYGIISEIESRLMWSVVDSLPPPTLLDLLEGVHKNN